MVFPKPRTLALTRKDVKPCSESKKCVINNSPNPWASTCSSVTTEES